MYHAYIVRDPHISKYCTNICLLYLSVTLRLVNEPACSEDNLTFSCEANESGLLVWTLVALPGVTGVVDSFGQNLNIDPNAVRITSTDSSSGPNPSSITIHNASTADSGATVQCRIVNMVMSNVITLSIRKLNYRLLCTHRKHMLLNNQNVYSNVYKCYCQHKSHSCNDLKALTMVNKRSYLHLHLIEYWRDSF